MKPKPFVSKFIRERKDETVTVTFTGQKSPKIPETPLRSSFVPDSGKPPRTQRLNRLLRTEVKSFHPRLPLSTSLSLLNSLGFQRKSDVEGVGGVMSEGDRSECTDDPTQRSRRHRHSGGGRSDRSSPFGNKVISVGDQRTSRKPHSGGSYKGPCDLPL